MIETCQTVTVNAPIDATWDYAKDVERWAEIMPGYQSCEIVDEDNSLWILKIGVGAMVRTVKVEVHVDRWAGPERVDFSFKLKGDPVEGGGSYEAASTPDGQTSVDLAVQVRGSGPMAPMWEAMGGPVLPKFAKGFAEQLKGRIEAQAGTAAPAPAARPSLLARLLGWLRRQFGG
ncbi:CoxG family protein [Novosphingobium album (ex Hu et al. 2023)]|uniref:SRPBCC family protein n=1 Tax=Novosphingobium album (ex Hu et al. 2023) TaxID=2930093 RepID=A0ABT0B5F9_9SPHN|nr:SRPBCC family protein [Novosphingobium album (ex Hu et al. 2023)]MCJ2180307.1 SRPBCC family protein [Novosphingobium album (ex Hu et al. 2023)]